MLVEEGFGRPRFLKLCKEMKEADVLTPVELNIALGVIQDKPVFVCVNQLTKRLTRNLCLDSAVGVCKRTEGVLTPLRTHFGSNVNPPQVIVLAGLFLAKPNNTLDWYAQDPDER